MGTPLTSTPAPATSEAAIRRARMVAGAMLVAVAVPVVVALVHVAGRHWFPAGDWSMLELRTRDVFGAHTPLLGPYSRYGWNHPGPLLFWYYAIPYRLTGGASWSLLVAAALANGAAVVGMLAFAWRRGELVAFAFVAIGLAILLRHVRVDLLWDPWNPWITVLPFGLLVIAAWAANDGDQLGLPITALTAMFLVETHIGFALPAVVLLVWAAIGAARRSIGRRPLYVSIAIVAVGGLPMLLDEAFGRRNIGRVLHYFTSGKASPVGLGKAVHIVARELGGLGPWIGDREPVEPIGGAVHGASLTTLVIPVLVFIVAALAAWSCGATRAFRLQATVAITAFVGLIAVSRISDIAFDYLIRWWWTIAMLWWVSIAYSLWSFVRLHVPQLARVETALGLIVVAGLLWGSIVTASRVDRFPLPAAEFAKPLATLTPMIKATLPHGASVLIDGTGPRVGWLTDAMTLQLDRAGYHVVRDDSQVTKVGAFRTLSHSHPTLKLTVATGERIDSMLSTGEAQEIGRWDPLNADDRKAMNRVEDTLRDQLHDVGRDDLVKVIDNGDGLWEATTLKGVDASLVTQLDRFRRDGYPVAAFVEPVVAPGGSSRAASQ